MSIVILIFEFFEAVESFTDHPLLAHELRDVVSQVIREDADDSHAFTEVILLCETHSRVDDLTR